MNREHIHKRINKISNRLQKYKANYDTMYSSQYKLEKNRIARVDLVISRNEKMLAYYQSLLIE
jgi:hypothetical protein